MQLTTDIDKSSLDNLTRLLDGVPKAIRKELRVAVNETARRHRNEIVKEVKTFIAVDQEGAREGVKITRSASDENISAEVTVIKGVRPSLKRFGVKQNKAGLTYKISPKGGRRTRKSGFMGPKPGAVLTRWQGHAFKRVGKARTPIQKQKGVSVWGAYVKNKLIVWSKKVVESELSKQMARRIRAVMVRKGEIVDSR